MGYNTSNPAFTSFFFDEKTRGAKKMTVGGIFIKSLFCLALLTTVVATIWKMYYNGQSIKWFSSGGMLAAIVISIVISVRQHWAYFLVPLYAVAKGFFLGAFSVHIHSRYPDFPFQAVVITVTTFLVMIILYKTKFIILTKQLRSTIITATFTIMVVYLVTWILSFFGINISFIRGTGWFAIAFNVFAALTASFALLIDIDYIDRYRNKAPKSKEWMATWGLLVTLIWLYVEVLRLMRKLAIR